MTARIGPPQSAGLAAAASLPDLTLGRGLDGVLRVFPKIDALYYAAYAKRLS